jgi:hypothetical protein
MITDLGGNEFQVKTTGDDPYFFTQGLDDDNPNGENQDAMELKLKFEYKSNEDNDQFEIFYFWESEGYLGWLDISDGEISLPKADDWTEFEFDLTHAYDDPSVYWGYYVTDLLRIDPILNSTTYEITFRDMRVEVVFPPAPPPADLPIVETFVSGNCGISSNITETRYTRTGYYMRKFNNHRSNAQLAADGFMRIFRLGELYLNFAEAAYNAYGADASVSGMSAREAVNTVRARVEMPELPAGLSKEQFEVRYRNERQVELAFEEHRFFDVRRWKILDKTDGFVTGMRITKEDGDYTYDRVKLQDRGTTSDKYLMYPIPLKEASKMENFTGVSWQNLGW